MTSLTESALRRDSAEISFIPGSSSNFDMSGSSGGPFTVFFRLVSQDTSPGHRHQPGTPLHTPFTQSPINSPAQGGPLPGIPLMPNNDRPMLYPLPSPNLGPLASPTLPGVYYTAAPPRPAPYYPPAALRFSNEHDPSLVKVRAMSAEIHHSPPFHYVPPQPHRGSFCLPPEAGGDLAMVSEEMLLSAMPDRYDD